MAAKKKPTNTMQTVLTEISSYEELKAALASVQELQDDIVIRMEAAGIPALEAKKDALKKLATEYAVKEGIERVDFPGAHATLIQQFFDGRFIGTEEDIRGDERDGVIPLRQIIRRKFKGDTAKVKEVWNQVTRRVVDKDAVDEAISYGILTVDDVAPAYVERAKSPYLRIFKD